jgi:diacylglycerol kinase
MCGFMRRPLSLCSLRGSSAVSSADWCWIILGISIVWPGEALNTAFELLADAASPDFHPLAATQRMLQPVRCS